jgi:RPA family protein
MPEIRKRETANKLRIGDLLKGQPIYDETPPEPGTQITNPRLLHVSLGDKKIVRVNLISNVIDKFESTGETKFATITVDDGSGQIRGRVFSDDLHKLQDIMQGDTITIIGLIRSYNQEIYILPEIVRKVDPKYLLIRKLELEKEAPKIPTTEEKKQLKSHRDDIIDLVKSNEENEGIDKDEIILKFTDAKPDVLSQEIQKLLEEGIIYEPKPGRVRYLG